MSITDNATGGVNEPEDFNKSESQDNSQGVNQDTRAANTSEGTGAESKDSANDNSQGFEHLGLPDKILQAVAKVGFTTPSPIQAETIPILMEGRDVVGLAQTGTGKTAAFALPVLSQLDPQARHPQALVLLNLTRDQLDRVGEINKIERALRGAVEAHPDMLVIANCDDVLMTSVAYDAKNVIWVSAGAGWLGDSVTCPRTGGHVVRTEDDWYAVKPLADGREFRRPQPTWGIDKHGVITPTARRPLNLALPGRATRGNAAQAIAAAVEGFGVDLDRAIAAAESIDDVAGRYSTIHWKGREIRLLLAKNPAGWQEALSMVDRSADGLVIATNGQVADGIDMSWLWDVKFEGFNGLSVKAAGERGTDLAVRLVYADITHELIPDPMDALAACPEGRIEVLANYTAFRDLKKALSKEANNA